MMIYIESAVEPRKLSALLPGNANTRSTSDMYLSDMYLSIPYHVPASYCVYYLILSYLCHRLV